MEEIAQFEFGWDDGLVRRVNCLFFLVPSTNLNIYMLHIFQRRIIKNRSRSCIFNPICTEFIIKVFIGLSG